MTPKQIDTKYKLAAFARKAKFAAIGPHWNVTLVSKYGKIQVISRTKPIATCDDGKTINVEMDIIEGTEFGDTIGFIDWSIIVDVHSRFVDPR